MRGILLQLWRDDAGAIIAAELLFIAALLFSGVMIGLATIRDAINTELGELANSYLALSQGYIISGQSGCSAATDGSQSIDTPSLMPEPLFLTPANPSVVDQLPCG